MDSCTPLDEPGKDLWSQVVSADENTEAAPSSAASVSAAGSARSVFVVPTAVHKLQSVIPPQSIHGLQEQATVSAVESEDVASDGADGVIIEDAKQRAPLLSSDTDPNDMSANRGISQTGWSIQGVIRKPRKTQATDICFIGGLAVETTAEELCEAAKDHGVTIVKCLILPNNRNYPDSRAAKAFVVRSDTERALLRDFWPPRVWCRPWHPPQSPGTSS